MNLNNITDLTLCRYETLIYFWVNSDNRNVGFDCIYSNQYQFLRLTDTLAALDAHRRVLGDKFSTEFIEKCKLCHESKVKDKFAEEFI